MPDQYTSLNPFFGIIETYKYPFARPQRTSFWQKMMDSFDILFGVAKDKPNSHPGLFDYATLFLRDLLNYLGKDDKNPILQFIGSLLTILLCLPLMCICLVIWSVFAFPIVGLLQVGINYFLHDDKEKIFDIEGNVSTPQMDGGARQSQMTLDAFLQKNHLNIEDLQITRVVSNPDNDEVQEVCLSSKVHSSKPENATRTFTTINFSQSSEAFFRLNVANIDNYKPILSSLKDTEDNMQLEM